MVLGTYIIKSTIVVYVDPLGYKGLNSYLCFFLEFLNLSTWGQIADNVNWPL